MALALRDNVTFCQVGERCIFLDVAADRYFCLAVPVEAQFLKLVQRAHPDPLGDPLLQGLLARGLLIDTATPPLIQPCVAPALPEASMLDQASTPPGRLATMSAVGRLAWVSAQLNIVGLQKTLTTISRGKVRLASAEQGDPALARHVAATFFEAAKIVTLLDNCLVQSLASAQALLAGGLRPDLILGVQLGPFQAHCWVQLDDCLVNDRFETVRAFVPILAL